MGTTGAARGARRRTAGRRTAGRCGSSCTVAPVVNDGRPPITDAAASKSNVSFKETLFIVPLLNRRTADRKHGVRSATLYSNHKRRPVRVAKAGGDWL